MELKREQASSIPAAQSRVQEQDQGWVPQACTLPTAEQPLRIAEFDALFAEAVTQVRRAAPGRVQMQLRAEPQYAERVAELVVRETECCSFFTFTLTATGGALMLEVDAADQHAEVVAALADRAADVVRAAATRARS